MAYSERYQSHLTFNADTKQAKQAIESLQNDLNRLLKTNSTHSIGNVITDDLIKAQKAVAELQVSLNRAFNTNTGKLDLSAFSNSLKNSGRSLQEYQTILNSMGPAGQKAFSNLAYQIQQAEIPLRRTGKLANELWTTLKNTARWQLSASLLQGFTGAVQKAFRYSQDLNKSLNDIRIVTGQSVEDMSRFAIEANKTAKALSTTTNEYAKASLIYFQQGLNDAEVKERTDVTIKMANVSRESAETVSDQMTAVWNNFADGSKTLEYYADIMTALGAATASSTAEITTGLEKFAAVAETVGLSYEYATTALATITDTTRQSADIVGNALKTLFARIQGLSLGETLEDGTDLNKYSEALAKVGISIKEQDGSLREMDAILDDMASKWQTLNKDQQVALAQTVAGVRQYTQLVALMDNWDKFEINLKVAEGAEGALQEQADIYAESWEAARDRVKASAEEIYDTLLNDEFFIDLTDFFADLLDGINNLSKAVGGLPGVLTIASTALLKLIGPNVATSLNNLVYNFGKGKEQLKALQAQASQLLIDNQPQNIQGTLMAEAYKQQGVLQQELLAKQEQLTEEQRAQYAIVQKIHKEKADSLITTGENIDALQKELKILERQIMVRSSAGAKQGARTTYQGTWNNFKNVNQVWQKVDASGFDPALGTNLDKLKNTVNELDKNLPKMSTNAKRAFNQLKQAVNDSNVDLNRISDAFLQFGEQGRNIGPLISALRNLGYSEEDAQTMAIRLRDAQHNLNYEMDIGAEKTQELDEYTKKLIADLQKQRGSIIKFGEAFTTTLTAVSQFAMGLNALKGMFDIFKDENMSDLEKTLTIITQIGFTFPMMISSIKQLTSTFSSLNILTTLAKGNEAAIDALVVKIAALNGVEAKRENITRRQILTYKISQTETYKQTAANMGLKVSADATNVSMKALGLTLLKWAVPIAAAVGVAILLVRAFKKIKENSPEAKLERATETANQLSKALSDATVAAEELEDAFSKYDEATAALDECVAGTKEWEQALKDANAAALELLKNHPELYGTGGVSNENGRIIISDDAKDQVQQIYDTRQSILTGAEASAQAKQREANIIATKSSLDDIVRGKIVTSDETALYSRLMAIMQNNGTITEYDLQKLQAQNNPIWGDELNNVYDELVIAVNSLNSAIIENTAATEIETNNAVRELVGDNYSDAVIKGLSNTYLEKVDSQKAAYTNKDDDDLFRTYVNLMGLSGASYNAEEQQYTLNGETYDLTRDAMIEALAVNSAKNNIQTDARQLSLLLGDNNTVQSRLVNEGAGALSKVEMAQIDANVLEDMVDLGAITQQVADEINAIPDDVIGSTNLEDTLSANLQQTFKTVFGENWSTGEIGAIISHVPADMRDEFAQAVSQTDWSDIDSAQAFGDLLSSMGIDLPIVSLNHFVNQMMDANNAVKNFNKANWSENIKETSEILQDLDVGGIINEEDLTRFTELDIGFGEYFTKMADGTYMLTKDAEEFYDLIRNAQLNEVKEAIQSNENEITRLRSEAEKAANDEKDDLADSYSAEADKLAKENSILQFQGLSMARSGEEFDQMANEDEFKSLNKTSESYQRLRNEIIETEEERGKEVETLEELNKLRNKGEIGNRGYAAGLTKLAKQYPQLNKEVAKYEEAMADYGKDSKEAANALSDLNNAMSAAQWKTAAQDLYDARYEIRELKAEYGSLATEMEEYQTALQDQADALTALFGVEVSPAFADAHADKIDEYLAGSQKAGYELMWLAEQQSGHIETVVNEYLASTNTSAEKIQNIITALDRLSFNIDGSADMTQVIEALLATGATGEQVAKMLNALGSSHIQFEVSTDFAKVMGDATRAVYDPSKSWKENRQAAEAYAKLKSFSITASGTVPSVDEFDLKTVSGKGGGSKGTKKVASDEKERFHVITKQIDSATAALEDYEKKREKAFGPLKNTYMDEEIAKTKNLISLQEQYIAEIKDYLASDEPEIKKYGAIIDADSGVITNYDEMMDKQIAIYNEAIEKAGTNEKAQEAAEKAYDLFIKALENYEDTYATYLDELAKLQDLQNEKIDKELEYIQDRLDAKLELEADQLTYLDYLIGKLDDEAYALADALVSLHDKTQPIMNQSDHYADAWEELQRTAEENGSWTQDMIDKLRELRDGLISTNEEMMELQKTIEEKVNEAIAECTDELDKQINRFDTYQNILQNYNDIIDLSGKKFKDYAMMLELSSLMTDNAINKLASSREKLETLGEAQINAQTKLELAEDSGDQDVIDYWKKTLEDIQIEVENATADMTSAWKEALQSASDAFESQVNLAIDNFKGGLEAFGDLDMISDSYDRAEKAAERYLEDFEKTYELSQLGRDITKAMNDATSAFAKDELAELMAEVNEKQKDGVKMSEYDLEVLKKKFELKQAELALEEAQNSMSQVRLTRDNEGNWSYQYTADQDKIDEALDEYETRLYEVAKLSDEYIDEMSQAIIDNQKDMYEALAGLRAEDFESYEEYEAKVREIVNFYTTQDAYLRDELAKAVGDTEYITTTMSSHYNNLSTSFTTVVDTMLGNTGDKTGNLKTWMESTDNLAEQAKKWFETELPKAYEAWEESVANAMEAAGTNTEDFKDDVSGYMEDIGDASDILADDIEDATDDMQDYIEDVMDAVWDWQEEYAAAIREMIAANEALIQSMMAVAAAQGAGSGGNEPSDYSRAIAELLEDGASINDPQILEWLEKRAKKDAEGKYLSNDRLMKLFTAYDNGDEKAIEAVKGVLYHNKWFTDEYLKPFGFNTGGYTGVWGPEGKMALVHEKELILNPSDTVNFLAGVNILREIAKMIDLQAANMAMPMSFAMPTSTSSGRQIDQNVHIQASFPGVQDRNEIEIALRSLVNEASQFVLE